MAICSAPVLHNIAIKHRDEIPHDEITDIDLDNQDDNIAEINYNMSRTEGFRKRTSIINTVFS